jgi:hypothetical protein
MTKDEQEDLRLPSLGRGADCRVLLSAPFLSLSRQVPVLNPWPSPCPTREPTWVMMNGVAGGGIHPEIPRPGGIY